MIEPVEAFKALADPVRLGIVRRLHDRGETCVCELLDPLGTSQANISAHLRILRLAGLVRSEKIGKWVFYRLDAAALGELLEWLSEAVGPASMVADRPKDSLYQACCTGGVPRSLDEAQERIACCGAKVS